MTLRLRIARWLVGPFFALPETGSWMVHHDAETDFTVGIRVSEWKGELRTELAPLTYGKDADFSFREHRTQGEFSGKFA